MDPLARVRISAVALQNHGKKIFRRDYDKVLRSFKREEDKEDIKAFIEESLAQGLKFSRILKYLYGSESYFSGDR